MTIRQFLNSVDWNQFTFKYHGAIRTKRGSMCPLQKLTGDRRGYVEAAKKMGLLPSTCDKIMNAADNYDDCKLRRSMLARMK